MKDLPRRRRHAAATTTLVMSLLWVVSSTPARSSTEVEPFEVNPSRPTYTTSPELGPPGGFEVNVGVASGLNDMFVPLQLKYTVSRDWEVRLGYNVLEAAYAENLGGSGLGDTQWMVQWCPSSLQWPLHWALWVLLTAPTGSSLRTGQPEFGTQFGLAGSIEWGRWKLENNFFVDQSIAEHDHSAAALNSTFVASFSITDALTLFLEDYDRYAPADGGLESRWLGGLALGLSERIVIDIALDGPIRTHRRADEIILQSGVSFILPVMERRTHTPTRPIAVALR